MSKKYSVQITRKNMKKILLIALWVAPMAIASPANGQILWCRDLDTNKFLILKPAQAWIFNAFRFQKKFVGQCAGELEGETHPYIYRKDLES